MNRTSLAGQKFECWLDTVDPLPRRVGSRVFVSRGVDASMIGKSRVIFIYGSAEFRDWSVSRSLMYIHTLLVWVDTLELRTHQVSSKGMKGYGERKKKKI